MTDAGGKDVKQIRREIVETTGDLVIRAQGGWVSDFRQIATSRPSTQWVPRLVTEQRDVGTKAWYNSDGERVSGTWAVQEDVLVDRGGYEDVTVHDSHDVFSVRYDDGSDGKAPLGTRGLTVGHRIYEAQAIHKGVAIASTCYDATARRWAWSLTGACSSEMVERTKAMARQLESEQRMHFAQVRPAHDSRDIRPNMTMIEGRAAEFEKLSAKIVDNKGVTHDVPGVPWLKKALMGDLIQALVTMDGNGRISTTWFVHLPCADETVDNADLERPSHDEVATTARMRRSQIAGLGGLVMLCAAMYALTRNATMTTTVLGLIGAATTAWAWHERTAVDITVAIAARALKELNDECSRAKAMFNKRNWHRLAKGY